MSCCCSSVRPPSAVPLSCHSELARRGAQRCRTVPRERALTRQSLGSAWLPLQVNSPCQGEGRGFESRRPLQDVSCSVTVSADETLRVAPCRQTVTFKPWTVAWTGRLGRVVATLRTAPTASSRRPDGRLTHVEIAPRPHRVEHLTVIEAQLAVYRVLRHLEQVENHQLEAIHAHQTPPALTDRLDCRSGGPHTEAETVDGIRGIVHDEGGRTLVGPEHQPRPLLVTDRSLHHQVQAEFRTTTLPTCWIIRQVTRRRGVPPRAPFRRPPFEVAPGRPVRCRITWSPSRRWRPRRPLFWPFRRVRPRGRGCCSCFLARPVACRRRQQRCRPIPPQVVSASHRPQRGSSRRSW